MGQNLTGQTIASTYEDLVQISGSILTNGLGTDITSLTVTASNAASATSASYAVTASYALNAPVVNTGSLMVTGSVSSNTLTFTKGDGSTFNLTVDTGSAVTVNTGSLLVTASISDATITFTKGDASTFGITVNNVVNANSASVATSASYALTASYAANAPTISTGSFYVSSSVNNATITFTQGDGTTEAVTVNNVVNANSASFATTAVNATSASYAANASTADSATTATSASHAVNADTASLALDIVDGLNINATSITASSATFTNLTATSASIGYLQTITGSATIIGDAFILLNTSDATRYAGILVEDSGSATPVNYTASFQFDSLTNDWFYEYSGSDPTNFGVAMFGPEYSAKGTPTYLTNNRIPKGDGGHHLNDSNISDNGTLVSIASNVDVTGSVVATVGFTGSLNGNADTATSASYAATASYVDLGTSATGSFTAASTWTFTHNLNQQPVVIQTFDTNWEEIIPQTVDLTDANTATISFPVSVAGYAVASLGNGITQGSGGGGTTSLTDLLSNTFYSTPVQTFDPPALTISSFNISSSGMHYISSSNATTSGSVNIYWHPDSLANGQVAAIKMTVPPGTGNAVSYRGLVSASNSTTYWYPSATAQTATQNLARNASRISFFIPNQSANISYMYKDNTGRVWFMNASSSPAGTPINGAMYEFSGSAGTPIV